MRSGMTQHTTGVQGIRSFTILQLLLGNIGKPGGGVNALRGEPNVQGACDMAVLYNYYPGYLNSPTNAEPTIFHYVRKNGIADSKYSVNTLKAFFGDAATPENDYAYEWLPKRTRSRTTERWRCSRTRSPEAEASSGSIGQNPAVTLPNLRLTFDAMAKLETLVVQEIWETETAAFWKRPGADPKTINTEVILLPAAFFMEKNGTISNSGGMVQWRHAAVKPPGQAEARRRDRRPRLPQGARSGQGLDGAEGCDPPNAFWTYTTGRGRAEGDQRLRGARQSGDRTQEGRSDPQGQRSQERWLDVVRRRGSTPASSPAARTCRSAATRSRIRAVSASIRASGGPGRTTCASSTTAHRATRTASRIRARNRSSGGTSRRRRWTGHDVPDVPSRPTARHAERPARLPSRRRGRRPLFAAVYKDPDPRYTDYWRDVAYVPKDGPLPEMYEPSRARCRTSSPGVNSNPTLKYPRVASHQPIGTADKFPYVLMTSTVAEHWCRRFDDAKYSVAQRAGPEPMMEMPITLAKKLDIVSGDWVKVSTARGELEVKALVTPRMKALKIGDPGSHRRLDAVQLGLPGIVDRPERQPPHHRRRGSGAGTQETKACLVNVVKSARPASRRSELRGDAHE
jgi:formate dehydrogenase major subunit